MSIPKPIKAYQRFGNAINAVLSATNLAMHFDKVQSLFPIWSLSISNLSKAYQRFGNNINAVLAGAKLAMHFDKVPDFTNKKDRLL